MSLDPSIDFEFRSGTDIGLGLPRYFGCAEAAPLCMSWTMDGVAVHRWAPGIPPLSDAIALHELLEHVRRGGKLRGWNVLFEWHVWNPFCVPLFGWPELPLEQCVDSMAEAAAMNLPQALGKCAAALNLPSEQQKDKRGKQLIKLLCIPQAEPPVRAAESYGSKGAYTRAVNAHAKWLEAGGRWINDPALLAELYDYCDQDVVTEVAVSRKLRRLSEYEQRVWIVTQRINLRGVPIDVREVRNISAVVEAEVDRLNEELQALTDNAVMAGSELGALRDWINERAPTRVVEELAIGDDGDERTVQVTRPLLEDMQGETIENTLADPELVLSAEVRRALEIRAAVGQTSTSKLGKMLQIVAPDGTLKNMHVYHGASTGRDASRGGLNLQNLARPSIKDIGLAHEILGMGDHDLAHFIFGDDTMAAAVATVRGSIKAPDGYEFTDADFSSVENRVGVWLAGQLDKVQMFRDGFDEYKVFASTSLYGIPYAEVDGHQRQVSKSAVLGCLFGQGAAGLVEYAKGYGVFLTLERAKEIVAMYRAEYAKVKKLWYACGDAAVEAVQNKGAWIEPKGCGGKLSLKCWNNFLWIRLPSGRLVAWAAPVVEMQGVPWNKDEKRAVVTVMQVDSVTKQWRRGKLIGSSIFQTAVQATARDLLMNACLNVEARGYAVVLRVHDELLSCNPIGYGSPEEFGELMCRNPAWCLDLPLAYEAWRGPRFRK